jgi:hypothetical protein
MGADLDARTLPAPVEIEKNRLGEVLRVELCEYKERTYVSLRVWVNPPEGGPMRPTRKGITFRPALLPDVVKALTALLDVAV